MALLKACEQHYLEAQPKLNTDRHWFLLLRLIGVFGDLFDHLGLKFGGHADFFAANPEAFLVLLAELIVFGDDKEQTLDELHLEEDGGDGLYKQAN